MENIQTKKIWLDEVSFMRPILLVLLVSYHAFAPYVGSWSLPLGIENVCTYKWLGLFSFAFLLEGYVFISGYIFTYQVLYRKKFTSFKDLAISKLERLIIPSIVFSLIYILLFKRDEGIVASLNDIIDGAGHLWYLPCLFWCFLMQYLILKKSWNTYILITILVFGLLLSIVPLPLRISRSLYYMMFFCGGGLFWRYSETIKQKCNTSRCIIAWMVFIILFFIVYMTLFEIKDFRGSTDIAAFKGMLLASEKILKAVLGWSGIFALYLTSIIYCQNRAIGKTILKIGACGYGVYVFHQFILLYLYCYTAMPSQTGTYLLPWIGMVITVVVSVSLTLAVRQTKLGRRYL
jgi:hypothetical protein